MVVYNELVAVAAGIGLIGVALLVKQMLDGKRIESGGYTHLGMYYNIEHGTNIKW